jgi:hypothetical protein
MVAGVDPFLLPRARFVTGKNGWAVSPAFWFSPLSRRVFNGLMDVAKARTPKPRQDLPCSRPATGPFHFTVPRGCRWLHVSRGKPRPGPGPGRHGRPAGKRSEIPVGMIAHHGAGSGGKRASPLSANYACPWERCFLELGGVGDPNRICARCDVPGSHGTSDTPGLMACLDGLFQTTTPRVWNDTQPLTLPAGLRGMVGLGAIPSPAHPGVQPACRTHSRAL